MNYLQGMHLGRQPLEFSGRSIRGAVIDNHQFQLIGPFLRSGLVMYLTQVLPDTLFFIENWYDQGNDWYWLAFHFLVSDGFFLDLLQQLQGMSMDFGCRGFPGVGAIVSGNQLVSLRDPLRMGDEES